MVIMISQCPRAVWVLELSEYTRTDGEHDQSPCPWAVWVLELSEYTRTDGDHDHSVPGQSGS